MPSKPLVWTCAATVLACIGHPSAAQVRVEAIVVDGDTQHPLRGAVVLEGGRPITVTDQAGRFVIPRTTPESTHLEIRRIGYLPATFELIASQSVVALRIVLERAPVRLDPLTVEADPASPSYLREFDRRRHGGFGHFITRETLERRPSAKVSDFLRVVPSVALRRNPDTGALEFYSRRAPSVGRPCASRLYVDGILVSGAAVDWIDPSNVAGIEVYRGPSETPIQFSGIGGCGAVVVIWTR